jgi:hypothetical protein
MQRFKVFLGSRRARRDHREKGILDLQAALRH